MKTAVLIPCRNEKGTIAGVVGDFRRLLPDSEIWVGDNDSSDGTASAAAKAGARILHEPRPGKGHVMRRMLREVEADLYLMVDGDGTYRAEDAAALLDPVRNGECDMCIGSRLKNYQPGSFGNFHLFGNRLIRMLTYRLHRVDIPDMLTGYRAFNRRTVDELSLIMGGFEIETEINIKCVLQGLRLRSTDVAYGRRPAGSHSKLKTIQDGYRILLAILMLLREHQPMTLGGVLFLACNLAGAALVVWGLATGNPRLPGFGFFLSLTGTVALATGAILHAVNISHRETEERLRRLGPRR